MSSIVLNFSTLSQKGRKLIIKSWQCIPASKTYGAHGWQLGHGLSLLVPILANHMGAIWGMMWAPYGSCTIDIQVAPIWANWESPMWAPYVSHMCFASGAHLGQVGISWGAWVRYPDGLCTWHTYSGYLAGTDNTFVNYNSFSFFSSV
jgi:hypothetical protein